MKLTVLKNELQKLLEDVASIIKKRSTLPIIQMAHISFIEKDKDGNKMYIMLVKGTDLETTITSGLMIDEVEDPKDFCVEIHTLLPLLKSFSEQPIELELNGVLKVKANNSVFDINVLEDDFPKEIELKEYQEYKLTNSILASIVETAEIAADDNLRPNLSSVCLDIKDNILNVIATDAHIMSKSTFILEDAIDNSIMIPSNAVRTIKKIVDRFDFITLRVTDKNISLSRGAVKYTIRLTEGKYPNYNAIIPDINNATTKLTINPEMLLKTLNRLRLVTENSTAIFNTSGMFVELSSVNVDRGNNATEMLNAQKDGDDIKIGFNSNLLSKLLGIFGKEDITFHIFNYNTAALITSDSNNNILCLVMPVMIN